MQTVLAPYDRIVAEFAAARAELRAKEADYLAAFLGGLKPPGTILDLGCGNGHPIASHLVARGHRVVGVDGSELMLAAARERHPEQRWIHGQIEAVEFCEQFDGVVCWDALFHLPRKHWAPIIRKVHGWLGPRGRLLMSSGGLVERNGRGFTDTMFGHEFYYDSLPPDMLLALLADVGFEVQLAEMCDLPDGGRGRGKWATLAVKSI